MVIILTSKNNLESKFKSILDTAKIANSNTITVMTERSWHIEVFDFLSNHKAIGKIKMGASTFFIIKEMRIELKPIDFYI